MSDNDGGFVKLSLNLSQPNIHKCLDMKFNKVISKLIHWKYGVIGIHGNKTTFKRRNWVSEAIEFFEISYFWQILADPARSGK